MGYAGFVVQASDANHICYMFRVESIAAWMKLLCIALMGDSYVSYVKVDTFYIARKGR